MSRFVPVLLATTALAAPAAAQDLCGTSGGQWIGGGEANSDIATADAFREQMALVLSGNEHISLFSLSAPTDVRIEAAGRGNGDPAIDVLDAAGNTINSDDDSGGNGASRVEMSLEAGTYCVATVSYDGSPMTAFVRVGRTDQEALTTGVDDTATGGDDTAVFGGTCADAPDLGTLDGTITGTGSANATPIWRFSLDAATAISVTATNEDADPSIALLSESNDFVGENDDFDGLNSRIDVTAPLAAGTYCIEVDALSDGNEPIEIAVSTYDPVAALAALYARGEAAPPLGGDVPITDLGTLTTRVRSDVSIMGDATWFSFDVPAEGLVVLEAIASGGSVDPWIALYDDLGRQLGLNDDHGDRLDSQLIARVGRGTYLMAIKEVGGGQGFVRLLAERWVPAE